MRKRRLLSQSLKRSVGADYEKKSTSVLTGASTGATSSKVLYRFSNKFYSNNVDSYATPKAKLKTFQMSTLPGADAKYPA